jgi:TetR/AcrR family transcriptional repressor of nem operon
MKKGDRTREHIIMKSAAIFNQRGYAGTSLNDIIADTGIKKGGIYRHLQVKMRLRLKPTITLPVWLAGNLPRRLTESSLRQGGCLLFFVCMKMLLIIHHLLADVPCRIRLWKSDDTHSELRDRARQGLHTFLDMMKSIIHDGIKAGSLRKIWIQMHLLHLPFPCSKEAFCSASWMGITSICK